MMKKRWALSGILFASCLVVLLLASCSNAQPSQSNSQSGQSQSASQSQSESQSQSASQIEQQNDSLTGMWRAADAAGDRVNLYYFKDDATFQLVFFDVPKMYGSRDDLSGRYEIIGSEIHVFDYVKGFRGEYGPIEGEARISFKVDGDTAVFDGVTFYRVPEEHILILYQRPGIPYPEGIRTNTPLFADRLLKYYDLTAEERELYNLMADAIVNLRHTVYLPRAYETETHDRVMKILNATLPECWWWDGEYGYHAIADDYQIITLDYHIFGEQLGVTLIELKLREFESNVDKGTKALNEVLAQLPPRQNMTDFEFEVAVHNWMINHSTSTDIGGGVLDSTTVAHSSRSMYGLFVDREGNCTGYSKAMQYVLNLNGIDCLMIHGANSAGLLHAWNAVLLDGEWYNLDVVNNEYTAEIYGTQTNYWLFNRTDQFLRDRGFIIGDVYFGTIFVAGANPKIECTATKYSPENMSSVLQ